MKQIKTLSNSFVLRETDGNGNTIFEMGYPKGGLTYLIKNKSIKFYLKEDYFYKNVVWSANIPLVIDGIPYGIDALPMQLKKIFENVSGGGGDITVDEELSLESINPVQNRVITAEILNLGNQILNRYTKEETNSLLESYYKKTEINSMFAGYSNINGDTLSLNDGNITI